MPIREPVLAGGPGSEGWKLRHIGPAAQIWPNAPGAVGTYAVLGQPTMIARPLSQSGLPAAPDYLSGQLTTRLNDAGQSQVIFPNAQVLQPREGPPWRSRFDPGVNGLRNEWIEIYNDGVLEANFCIFTSVPDYEQVLITGYDAVYLLKNAYERDWIVTLAPRDVFERGTQLWVPTTSDNFLVAPLNTGVWTFYQSGGSTGSAVVGNSGGLTIKTGASDTTAGVKSAAVSTPNTAVWRSVCTITTSEKLLSTGAALLVIGETYAATNGVYFVALYNGLAQLYFSTSYVASPVQMGQVAIPTGPVYTLMMESDGEFVWGFVNGQLIGCCARDKPYTAALETYMQVDGAGSVMTVSQVMTEAMQPYLMPSADKGDYVLPGDASTYPNGGLHARYFTDTDLASLAGSVTGPQGSQYLSTVLNPTRTQAYAGSNPLEYVDQQDTQVKAQANANGAPSTYWSCIWFGAVWLELANGDYGFEIDLPAATGVAVRVWVGQTSRGSQLVGTAADSAWSFSSGSASYAFTVSATTLAGTLPNGAGTISRNGWYPIKIYYAVGSASHVGPTLKFTPPGVGTYVDPGGTTLTGGVQVDIPSSSLTADGCIDNRFQGVAHFDLCQSDILQAVGYQATLEPQRLESGNFPGVFAPRIREGSDSDTVLIPNTQYRADGELVTNYSNTEDATDSVSSLAGNGAGFQNGASGQLQGITFDPVTLQNSLFDVQGWQDFGDASWGALLGALLTSELGNRLTPWETIAAQPVGMPRLAGGWPIVLPEVLAARRWRPGDGVRVHALEIDVYDTQPRQLLQVQKSFEPMALTQVGVTLASGPMLSPGRYPNYSSSRARSPAKTLKTQLRAATRYQRSYQRQLVEIAGTYVTDASIAAGAIGSQYSIVSLNPGDQLVRSWVRVNRNVGNFSFDVLVNLVDQTSALNGPWTTVPVYINLGPVTVNDFNGQIYVHLQNNGASPGLFSWQLTADVLR